MKIVIVTPNYPFKGDNSFVFLKQVVDEFARKGNQCYVVAPFSVCHYESIGQVEELYGEDAYVKVYRPRFLSFSNRFPFLRTLSTFFRRRAVERVLESLDFIPDVIYCHFWGSAYYACRYAQRKNAPLFVATGESDIAAIAPFERRDYAMLRNNVDGVVAVSEKNRKESISLGLTTSDKCIVLPNAVDPMLFRPIDRNACREELGIDTHRFVVAFVGSFGHRKGNERLDKAVALMRDESVGTMYMGNQCEPPFVPGSPGVLYCGSVDHVRLPIYLNAADVFVLPTLKEGCCNAIVEAMACGLPIVSSDRDFNEELLTDNNSILIDPMNVEAISRSIAKLRDDDELRHRLSVGALSSASSLSIESRCEAILNFMKERISKKED